MHSHVKKTITHCLVNYNEKIVMKLQKKNKASTTTWNDRDHYLFMR